MSDIVEALRSARRVAATQPLEALAQLQQALHAAPLTMTSFSVADLAAAAIAEAADQTAPRAKVAILCGALSPSMLIKAVRVALAANGVIAEIFEGNYNGFRMDAISPGGPIYQFKPDVVLIAVGWRDISRITDLPQDAVALDALLAEEVSGYEQLWSRVRDLSGAIVMQHLFDRPDQLLLGVAERRLPRSPWRYIERLNAALLEAAGDSVKWLDQDALAMRFGLANWSAPRDFNLAQLPFGPRAIPSYTSAFSAVYRESIARAKKVLVLDLDNTLWGGVIGDDGIDGIRFGHGSPEGEAFLAFATYVRAMKNRGVTLAVCSKNNPDLPRRVFSELSEMPLRLSDFAAFRCNWNDKASNLREIASELNLGLDSFVFVDDNPAECELVRQELPQVTVVALPSDPSEFPQLLDGLRLFDAQRLTETDTLRAESYQALRDAENLKNSFSNMEDFLVGLEMRAGLRLATPADIPRLAQMEARTNQFNTTGRRYSADQLAELLRRNDAMVLVFSLRDRLAHHGVVSSAVVLIEEDALRIDSWLMSCRVFARTAEQFIANWLFDEGRRRELGALVADFEPTPRNTVIADLFANLGFSAINDDARSWRLDLADADVSRLRHFITPEEAGSSDVVSATRDADQVS